MMPIDAGLKHKFRLAILITHLGPGGAERVSVTLANRLAQSGWLVSLITMDSSVPDFYRLDCAVNRVVLPGSGSSANALAALTSNLSRFRSLRNTLRDLHIDTLLGMTSQCAVLAILASLGMPNQSVAAERNYPPLLRIKPSWHRLRKLVYRYADTVVVQSEAASEWVARYTGARRIAVIPNPISLPLPSVSTGATPPGLIDDSRPVILAVGRLTPQKGFATLIEAFHALHRDFPDWVLVIIGEGPQRTELQHAIDSRSLGARVIMPGTTGDIATWYRRADVFVLSSAFEGFPNVLLEAMAHGRCVVSFDCKTGPAELIENDVNGVLVEPVGDAVALAKELSGVLRDPTRRSRLGSQAADVLNRYQTTRVVQSWKAVLDNQSKPGS